MWVLESDRAGLGSWFFYLLTVQIGHITEPLQVRDCYFVKRDNTRIVIVPILDTVIKSKALSSVLDMCQTFSTWSQSSSSLLSHQRIRQKVLATCSLEAERLMW